MEVAFIGPKPTAGRCRRLFDDMLAALLGGPFETFNGTSTMCGTASFSVRELIAELLERGMAMQTFWGFYITVSLGLVVFFGNAKHSSPPIISGVVVSIMFGAFAYVNCSGMLAIASQREFLYNTLRSVADVKGATLDPLDLQVARGFLERATPPSPKEAGFFHMFADVVVVGTILFFAFWPLIAKQLSKRKAQEAAPRGGR